MPNIAVLSAVMEALVDPGAEAATPK